MTNVIRALLVLLSSSAFADTDVHFGRGVAGCLWGVSLQEVQGKYPGGFAWSHQPNEPNGEVTYAVSGTFTVPGVEVPSRLVHFIFSKDNGLQTVIYHFNPADREAVLYQVAQLLGQDYSIRDQALSRRYEWKPGQLAFARYEIGNGPNEPWAFFGVRTMKDCKSRSK